ncbi:hypothetical protein [Scandinavium goeteborgense]|uniref:hypothetical protein n=1 Tax=Scandinavium goeteborgense TaxID=1851514 RepID=UPI001060A721|nr:hypothetical protein [Scandinavium goeteborgense]
MQTHYGKLAKLEMDLDLPLKVLETRAGFYIGTFSDELVGPVSRESVEYFSTREQATDALNSGVWTQRESC